MYIETSAARERLKKIELFSKTVRLRHKQNWLSRLQLSVFFMVVVSLILFIVESYTKFTFFENFGLTALISAAYYQIINPKTLDELFNEYDPLDTAKFTAFRDKHGGYKYVSIEEVEELILNEYATLKLLISKDADEGNRQTQEA